MIHVKVTFEDGNTLITGFNGTLKDATKYYVGQTFQFGDTDAQPNDHMVMAVKVEPACPLSQQRAQELWSQRGPQNTVRHAMTDNEAACVDFEWDAMGGYTSWMDAFFRFLNGTADAQ